VATEAQTKIESKQTSLYALHKEAGGKLVDFAGYQLPIQYEGILAEHNHTRKQASLFDVSHMGQATLHASAETLEKVFPADLVSMQAGQMRYSFLLNEAGGILDDLMITKRSDDIWQVVVNGACKEKDYAHLEQFIKLERHDNLALLALQGPEAKNVLRPLHEALPQLPFMNATEATIAGIQVFISRSGYTGEDGYEISLQAAEAESFAQSLLKDRRVKLAGLGARDTLRLEAGLCLYNQDIDETTSPIEAGLSWAIAKRRKEDGGFVGAQRIQQELQAGVQRKRIGLSIQEKRPVRAPSALLGEDGAVVGRITSGGVAASQSNPIAMGYINASLAKVGTQITASQRGKIIPAQIIKLPFRPHNYYSK
jgi:aminomethyltransferase